MKIVLELKNTPRKNDILVFDGKRFECVSKESLTKRLELDIRDINIALSSYDNTLQELAREIRLLKGEE